MTSRVRLGGILSAFGLALAAGWSWSEARAGEEFIATGARHQAMGGTGVAAARGADALAWNPALLPRFMEVEGASSEAPEKETPEEAARREAKLDEAATQAADEWPLVESSSWNAELVTVEAMVSDQGDAINQVKLVADKLESTTGKFNNIQSSLNNPTAATSANLQTAVKDLLDTVEDVVKLDQPGVGLYESLHLGAVGVRVGPFALGFAGYQYGSVDPVVDVGAGGFNSIATAGFNSVFSDGGGTGPIDPNNVGGQSAPTTPAGQSLATQLAALPGMTQDRAEAIAILGEQAGVDLSNPTLRDTINNITTATAQNTSAAPASAETLFFNNQTGVDVKTLTLLEIQMGYGHYFEEFNLGLGVAPKVLLGSTSVDRFALADFQNNQASDFIDDIDAFDFFGSSSDPGDTDVAPRFSFDAGAAWNATDFWRLGLVGKNIIPATFDLKNRTTTANNKVVVTNAGDVTIGPAVRAGTALHFLRDRIVLSADYDLLPQRSDLLTGFESQLAGAGVELTPIASDWFAPSLRAGIYKNLRGSKEDSVLTLGLGLRVLFVEFGFAVAQPRFIMDALKGLDENDLDKTPQRMNAAFTIGINTSF